MTESHYYQVEDMKEAEHKYETPEYEEEYEPKRKIQKLDHDEKPIFEPEFMLKIISHLDDIDDIKNCFRLSTKIRNLMLESNQIMQRLIFIFEPLSDSECANALMGQRIGKYIRNVKVQLKSTTSNYMNELSRFLNQTPNLESLVFKVVDSNPNIRCLPGVMQQVVQSSHAQTSSEAEILVEMRSEVNTSCMFDLPNLKSLNIRFQDLRKLMDHIYSLENLETLSLSVNEFKNDTLLIDFFIFVHNLKDLSITECEYDEKFDKSYPYKDLKILNEKINFKLKRFALNARNCNDNFVTKFIKTQVENLEELELTFELDENIFGPIWSKFKKLRKLKLSCVRNHINFIEHFHDVHIETVTSFDTTRFSNLKKNIERFPNFEIFNSMEIVAMYGEFTKITTLNIEFLNLSLVKGGMFPNLKYLTVTRCIEPCENKDWISFCKNISNVENVRLKIHYKAICDCCVFDCLSIFKKLKKFSFEHNLKFLKKYSEENFNEYYKVAINTIKKTVKICNFIVENDMKIFLKVYENFGAFEFTEICFEDDMQESLLFDPADALINRTKPKRTIFLQKKYYKQFKICEECYSDKNLDIDLDMNELFSDLDQFFQ